MPIVLDGGGTSVTPPGSPDDFALDAVYPFVMPSAKSVAYSLMDQAITSAADQILRRTRLWNVQLDPMPSVAAQSDYSLVLPVGAQCTKLIGWAMDGVMRRTLTLDQATAYGLDPGYTLSTNVWFDGDVVDGVPGYPVAYLVYENVARVLPVPADALSVLTFRVNLTVQPTGVTSLPGVLAPYLRLLSYGALEILQGMPVKDFTDLQQASLNAGRFNDGVAKLAMRVARAFGAATPRPSARFY